MQCTVRRALAITANDEKVSFRLHKELQNRLIFWPQLSYCSLPIQQLENSKGKCYIRVLGVILPNVSQLLAAKSSLRTPIIDIVTPRFFTDASNDSLTVPKSDASIQINIRWPEDSKTKTRLIHSADDIDDSPLEVPQDINGT